MHNNYISFLQINSLDTNVENNVHLAREWQYFAVSRNDQFEHMRQVRKKQ